MSRLTGVSFGVIQKLKMINRTDPMIHLGILVKVETYEVPHSLIEEFWLAKECILLEDSMEKHCFNMNSDIYYKAEKLELKHIILSLLQKVLLVPHVQRLIHHIRMTIFGQKPGQTIYQRVILEQVGLDRNLSILL